MTIIICDALGNLVPFVQFKKRESTHEGVLLFVKLQPEFLQNGMHTPPGTQTKEQLGIFAWNLGPVKKTSIETYRIFPFKYSHLLQ